jgi:transcription-repair coupling factor (superfamily II helicase)
LKKLERGEIDIIIGTHRLLQKDIKFKDLGLVIIDEEQRFGVKQKEIFKKMRAEVDIITLTATPIPRTLNISLNGLRDITTITTPPPGRLPIVTEVRRFSFGLIREAILRELERKGQIYYLHNRVQTIDSAAQKLKSLIPEARIVVTHGKLKPDLLEKNILAFKQGKYDVLVSSMIIENGIDLPNANTLIVSDAEKFGLAQLYQLRGRVGRSRTQAYAYFLYHAQRLKLDAKKRLRAIVEATELGSGFQIAMKDLEIRGAGEILGVHQHGTLNVVGVTHFVKMLNQAVENMKAGKEREDSELAEVTVELPITAFIPDIYIPNIKDKISVYQKLSSADTNSYLEELRNDLIEDYGKYPEEVANLFFVLELKIFAKKAGITTIKAENIHDKLNRQIVLFMTDKVKPENIMSLLDYNKSWMITGSKLKIKAKDLGVGWTEELKESIARLSKKYEVKV